MPRQIHSESESHSQPCLAGIPPASIGSFHLVMVWVRESFRQQPWVGNPRSCRGSLRQVALGVTEVALRGHWGVALGGPQGGTPECPQGVPGVSLWCHRPRHTDTPGPGCLLGLSYSTSSSAQSTFPSGAAPWLPQNCPGCPRGQGLQGDTRTQGHPCPVPS